MTTRKRWFILVAGINGAGKSTFAQDTSSLQSLAEDLGGDVEIINPDLVTRDLLRADAALQVDEANLLAAVACEKRVHGLIEAGTSSFAIETVLSTDKY